MNVHLKTTLSKMGVTFNEIPQSDIVLAKLKKKKALFVGGYTPLVPYIIGLVLSNKSYVKQLLEQNGFEIPQGKTFSSSDIHSASQYIQTIQFPIILRQENSQLLISAKKNINTLQQFKKEFSDLTAYKESILIEEQLTGTHYKVFIHKEGWIHIVKNNKNSIGFISSIEKVSDKQREFDVDVTTEYYEQIYPIAKRILALFTPLICLSFDCILVEQPKQRLIVTEVYHSVSQHFPYNAKKGKQKKSITTIVSENILTKFQ